MPRSGLAREEGRVLLSLLVQGVPRLLADIMSWQRHLAATPPQVYMQPCLLQRFLGNGVALHEIHWLSGSDSTGKAIRSSPCYGLTMPGQPQADCGKQERKGCQLEEAELMEHKPWTTAKRGLHITEQPCRPRAVTIAWLPARQLPVIRRRTLVQPQNADQVITAHIASVLKIACCQQVLTSQVLTSSGVGSATDITLAALRCPPLLLRSEPLSKVTGNTPQLVGQELRKARPSSHSETIRQSLHDTVTISDCKTQP
eukprot:SM000002S05739  [mRNA]  locus=s2:1951464:1952234:- [translate_table: standard]